MSISSRGEKLAKFDVEPITFTETDANGVHFLHNDALIVETVIGNHTICRILVDNGSSVDILYLDCLEKMGIKKSQLMPNSQPFYGFTRNSFISEGLIRLPLTVGG
ncbi:hypothetical protein TIFTF001_012163 [Ficus carica]|uniref:Uncharacterized protein n=1 Tax=Ficus carica TaxID=3494 RepID=A0AA87ZVI1_FICCA|nr:hypothetical protein TIFTF001_012163 [Ficus carica]